MNSHLCIERPDLQVHQLNQNIYSARLLEHHKFTDDNLNF